MSNYLSNVLKVTEEALHQAAYVPQSISSKPAEGCGLPILGEPPGPLGFPALPNNLKSCAPPFIPFPIVPELFPLPENCPNGISFTDKTVNIFAQVSDVAANRPSGAVTVGASQGSSVCDFQINIPPIVIPCFPTGPQISSNVGITVVDPNQNTIVTTPISIDKSSEVACNWQINGNPTIILPKVPCPTGITFKSANLDIKTSLTSAVVDRSVVSIAKDVDNNCSFDIKLPSLTIPCYPNGPSITGGLSLVVTDSVAGTSTQTDVNFKSSSTVPCAFSLGGDPIQIDIPCSTNGIGINFEDLKIKDPYTDTTTSIPIPPGEHTDLCNIDISIPPIQIPCFPDGIRFKDPIYFSGLRFSDNTRIPIRNVGINFTNNNIATDDDIIPTLRDPNIACSWGGVTIDLPIPICDGGFEASTGDIKIKLNNNVTLPNTTPDNPEKYTRYNSLSLRKKSIQIEKPGTTETVTKCGFELIGDINLGLPAIASCNNLTIGTNGLLITTGQAGGPTTSSNIISLKANSACDYQFTSPSINIPALICDTFNSNPTVYTGGEDVGKPITPLVVKQNGAEQAHSIRVVTADPDKPYCSAWVLTGELNITSNNSGGAGVGMSPWSNNQCNKQGDSVLMVYPEGSFGSFSATCDTCDQPGTPDTCWNEQYQSFPGPVFAPYTVIKCKEPMDEGVVTTPNPTWLMTDSIDNVKVIPASYLFKSESSIDRYNVFGLDTPFKLSPGQIVYLEIVTIPSNNYGETSIVYAAVCRGDACDFNSGTVAAATKSYKTLTPTQAAEMDIADYCTKSVGQIVGIDNAVAQDLMQLQTAAISAIKNKGTSDRTTYQFKTYITIAKAEKNIPNSAPTDGSKINKSIGSWVTLKNNNDASFSVKQIVKTHLTLRAVNDGSMPLKIIVPAVAAESPEQINLDSNKSNPDLINMVLTGDKLSFDFRYNQNIDSELMTYFPAEFEQLLPSYTPIGLINNRLSLGVKSNNIHVYYTLDGSVPTINTEANKKSFRYDPAHKPANIDAAAVKNINWIAVYHEYTTAPFRSIES